MVYRKSWYIESRCMFCSDRNNMTDSLLLFGKNGARDKRNKFVFIADCWDFLFCFCFVVVFFLHLELSLFVHVCVCFLFLVCVCMCMCVFGLFCFSACEGLFACLFVCLFGWFGGEGYFVLYLCGCLSLCLLF